MASDRILTLNIGAGQITLGEFRVSVGKKPELIQYGTAPLGLEPDSDMDPSGFINAALTDIMKETGIKPGPLMMTISGQAVFPRFVKLPAVSKDKLGAMVQYEAEQNVPFPIDELTWDYQLIGSDESGEQNAMIVAAKTDSIVALTSAVAISNLEPEVVGVAPLAVYNCVRASYPDLTGSVMVLDIGSRSTNLVFIEEGKVFYRSIPVAGNAITQEIAKTFGIDFRTAEQMKKESGFVALGGVTGVDDEDADRMSKCIRSVVTRLHAEINRSINFYRSQQGGSPPTKLFLTGGSSILQQIDVFFREKLKVEVEYLNPFTNVTFGPRVNTAKASEEFYELAEIVGMAFRRSGLAPVEIDLMPPNLVQKKTFRKRVPFFIIAAIALVGAAFFAMLFGNVKENIAKENSEMISGKLNSFKAIQKQIADEELSRDAVIGDLDQYRALIEKRSFVLQWIDAIRSSVLKGMWIVSIEPSKDGTSLIITSRGFQDQLSAIEKANGKQAAEIFGNNLSGKEQFDKFDEQRGVTQHKNLNNGNIREFTISIKLKDNYQFK